MSGAAKNEDLKVTKFFDVSNYTALSQAAERALD
jgi:hypothetical protein